MGRGDSKLNTGAYQDHHNQVVSVPEVQGCFIIHTSTNIHFADNKLYISDHKYSHQKIRNKSTVSAKRQGQISLHILVVFLYTNKHIEKEIMDIFLFTISKTMKYPKVKVLMR